MLYVEDRLGLLLGGIEPGMMISAAVCVVVVLHLWPLIPNQHARHRQHDLPTELAGITGAGVLGR